MKKNYDTKDGALNFGEFLKKYAQLRGWKQKNIAELTGFSQGRINSYFRNVHNPEPAIIDKILRDIGARPEEYYRGVVSDPPEDYYKPPSTREKRILEDVETLLQSGDQEIIDHLKRQVAILLRVPAKEKP